MPNTPQQLRRREQVEALVGLAAPFLDLLLATGDRVARAIAPPDDQPAIPPGERLGLGSMPGAERHPEA